MALQAAAALGESVDFERHIAPLLASRCVGCHNAGDPAGKLDLSRLAGALTGGESGTPALVVGQPGQSQLLERVRSGDMPPPGKGQRPSDEEIARLDRWIADGARWPGERVLLAYEFTSDSRAGFDWWSLRAPAWPAVPQVRQHDRLRSPIDAFVVAALEERGLSLADEADRATLIRRASFDLIGLPPTPAEVEQFVADTSPDAYERLIDRLLASPRYGERWARHWLDVVRFGESNGYETNTARPNAWPYRDWVIGALNDDVDYRRFVLEQLAGDQTGTDAATGFLVGGPHDTVSSPDVELTLQQRANDLDDMISTTAGAFLGLTAGCAKCHDHKFDPISQRDYYALQAIFAGVEHGERELRTPDGPQRSREAERLNGEVLALRRQADELWTRNQPLARVESAGDPALRPPVRATLNVERFAPVAARMVRFSVQATTQLEPCLDELEVFAADQPQRNVALAQAGARAAASSTYAGGTSKIHRLEHIHDGQYGNGRSWISGETGSGWVRVEWPEATTVDRVVWARDREDKFRDRLPTRYTVEVSADGNAWQTVATGEDRLPYHADDSGPSTAALDHLPPDVAEQIRTLRAQADALAERAKALAPAMIYAGTFEQPGATHVLYRGEPLQKRDAVGPGGIASVGQALALAADSPEAERRIALARWIGSDTNPLSARVVVNRLWHHHFGQGLVKTPSDLGWGGGLPSHPALLDWLATEFVRQGWRLKPLHRAIMLSSVYRQSSRPNASAAAIDADARLLWRMPPRRLEAEAIRDAILATSGVLDLRMGGPGYDVFEPNTNYVKVYNPKTTFTPVEWRRMVYQNKPRLRQDATFGAFDCPDASQSMPRRNISTTAPQALNLLNGPFVVEQAKLFAARLAREAGHDTAHQVARGFSLAFGRAPADEELRAARHLVEQHGLVIFCRALLNANEFLYVN
ncbi:MAG: DUF1553 domain-containing protein [Pirellulales bacterium]